LSAKAGSRGPRGYPASVVALAGSSAFTQLALLVSGPLAVRVLGLEGRGQLAVLVASTIFMSQVGAAGLPAAFAYMISSGRVAGRQYLRRFGPTYAVQSILVAVGAAALFLALTRWTDASGAPAAHTALAALGTGAILATLLAFACLQGEHRFITLAVLQAAPAGWYALALALFLVAGTGGVSGVATTYFAGWLAVAACGLFLVWTRTAAGYRRDPPVAATRVRHYAVRAMTATAAPIDGLAVDQLLLALVVTRHDLGLYVVGYAFATACSGPLVAVSTMVAPRLAALGPESAGPAARRWLGLALVAGGAAAVTLELVVGFVLPWAFGEVAREAVPVARILIVAGMALGFRRVGAAVLLGLGRPGAGTFAEVAGFVVLLVTFPLGASVSVSGGAWCLCAAALSSCAVQLVLLRRAFGKLR
jgi:O-antigen/teichoic acid export membrane protein